MIVASIHCNGGLSSTSLSFTYNVDQFSDGNVFTSGGIIGSGTEAFEAKFYSMAQVGFATAPIIVTFDVFMTSNGGYWTISLDRTTLITSLVYRDAELSDPGMMRTWTMTPDKCVVNKY